MVALTLSALPGEVWSSMILSSEAWFSVSSIVIVWSGWVVVVWRWVDESVSNPSPMRTTISIDAMPCMNRMRKWVLCLHNHWHAELTTICVNTEGLTNPIHWALTVIGFKFRINHSSRNARVRTPDSRLICERASQILVVNSILTSKKESVAYMGPRKFSEVTAPEWLVIIFLIS